MPSNFMTQLKLGGFVAGDGVATPVMPPAFIFFKCEVKQQVFLLPPLFLPPRLRALLHVRR